MSGKFVTVEGPDGAGKTTVIQALVERLRADGVSLITTREPGGSVIAEKIRELILDPAHTEMDQRTEALLYAAARRQHLVEKVLPALAAGQLVICDRFVDSSLAYQGVARGIGMAPIAAINQFATDGITPSLTLYLDVDTSVGLARVMAARGTRQYDRLDQEAVSFHEAVRAGYLQLAEEYPERIVTIDANDKIANVVSACYDVIIKHLGRDLP